MRKLVLRNRSLCTAVLSGSFILGGCDPTIQSTVEDGIISVSTALLGSFFQALLQVALTPMAT